MPVPIDLRHLPATPDDGTLLVVGARPEHLAEDVRGLDEGLAALAGFEGKVGQTFAAATDAGACLVAGLGADPTADDFRRIGAAIAKAAVKQPAIAVDVLGGLDGADRVRAAETLTEGLGLGAYAFADYKDPAPGTALESVAVVAKGGQRVADAVARGAATAAAQGVARDLVNTPGGDLTPPVFADQIVELAGEHGLEVEVLDKAAIVEARMGGLLGVNRGSTIEPRFVTLRYRPEGKPRGRVALVGKGITFDSGGLSIKPSNAMETMKNDMGGAAAVVGAMLLVPLVAPKLEVTAYLPLTDNMLGGDATRVGDVLRARNGTTIEVLNTDAEGRLILADALVLAAEDEPDAIIDVATLTGAAMVALGDRTAAVMANHDELRDRVLAAGESAGEALWPMPLPDHIRKGIDSDLADLKNMGNNPYGGAMTAGVFLREFVDGRPWAHLDIAGPAFASAPYDETPKGGTGFGVRTLAKVLAGWSKLPA